jgi:hypothetical protein
MALLNLIPLSREEAVATVSSWLPIVLESIEKKRTLVEYPPELVELPSTNDEVLHSFDFDKALLSIIIRDISREKYSPLLVVSRKDGNFDEDKPREYAPLRSSNEPNYDRVVKTAIDLSISLSDSGPQTKIPKGVLVSPSPDGNFLLHVPLIEISKECLDIIVAALNNE